MLRFGRHLFLCYRARLANNHLGGGSVAGDADVDQIHALGHTVGADAEAVLAFGDMAEVAVHHHATVEVVDAELCVAGSFSAQGEVSHVGDGVRIEAEGAGAGGGDGGDVDEVGSLNDIVGEVGDIGHIHEDAAAVGAEVDGAGPFGACESIVVGGDAGVGEVAADGIGLGLLAHGGHGDVGQTAVGVPTSGLVEETLGGADVDVSGGILDDGAVGGNVLIAVVINVDGETLDAVVGLRSVVDDGDIVVLLGIALEGENQAVVAFAGVDGDRADGAVEPLAAVDLEGIDIQHTVAVGVVHIAADEVVSLGEVDILETADAEEHRTTGTLVDSAAVDEAAVVADDSVAEVEVGEVSARAAGDNHDGAPDHALVGVGGNLVAVPDAGEVGGLPVVPHDGGEVVLFFLTDGNDARLDGVLDGDLVVGGHGVLELVLEGVVGMATAVEGNLVVGLDDEAAAATGAVAGVVEVDGAVATEDVAEGVDGEGGGRVEDGVFVGLPEVEVGLDIVVTLVAVGGEGGVDGPGGGVGEVEVVGIGAAHGDVGGGDDDVAARVGFHLLEGGGGGGAAVAVPEDVGAVVEDEGAVVVPGDVGVAVALAAGFGGEAEVVEGLDEGAGVAVGATQDGAVGSHGEAGNLEAVETAADVGIAAEVAVGHEDAAVGGDVEAVGLDSGVVDGENLVDVGVDEAGVVEHVGHVVAAVEVVLIGGGLCPEVVGVFVVTFTDPDGGTADGDALVVGGVDGEGTAVVTGVAGEGVDRGGGQEMPGLLVGGEVESREESVGEDSGVEVVGVGGGHGEEDVGGAAAEGDVGGRDVDGVDVVAGEVGYFPDLVADSEVAGLAGADDLEVTDVTAADFLGGDSGAFDFPAVETLVSSGEEVGDAVTVDEVDIVDGHHGEEVGGGGHFGEHAAGVGGIGVEAEEADALARHGGVVGGAEAELVTAGADVDVVVLGFLGALDHAADGEGELLAVDDVGDVVPDGGVASESEVEAESLVEVVEDGGVGGPDEEAATDGSGIEGGVVCILPVGDKARNSATDVVGTDFVESRCLSVLSILSIQSAARQSHEAHKQAEKYFVTFHKILIIN